MLARWAIQLEEEMCTMTPFAATAVKILGSGAAAALLSVGVAGTLAQAATPSPTPNTSTTAPSRTDRHVDHKQLTQARADRILDRISKGNIPFWDGIRPHER